MSTTRRRRKHSRVLELTPTALGGLKAWGEGSDLGADGTAVASWLNKTGSGLDPAQATAGNQPTVVANAINGQKAVRFTAASIQLLAFPAGALGWFQSVPGATFALVVKPVTVTAAQLIDVTINASTTGRLSFQSTVAGPVVAVRPDDATVTSVTGATAITAVPLILVASIDTAGGSLTILVNNAVDATHAIAPAQKTPNTPSNAIALGGNPALSSAFDGYIAAYAMWSAPYTRGQLAGVLRRWAHMYGVRIS